MGRYLQMINLYGVPVYRNTTCPTLIQMRVVVYVHSTQLQVKLGSQSHQAMTQDHGIHLVAPGAPEQTLDFLWLPGFNCVLLCSKKAASKSVNP